LAAARCHMGAPARRLEQVLMTAPLLAGAGEATRAQVHVAPAAEGGGGLNFRITGAAEPLPPGAGLDAGEPVVLEATRPGTFETLRLRPSERRAPGRGEVEIEVRAAGLNFMDVLKSLGLYPGI